MQPALFCPSGWLARRFSLQIRMPWRISRYGLEGSSSFTAQHHIIGRKRCVAVFKGNLIASKSLHLAFAAR